jgi:hypothetical protein
MHVDAAGLDGLLFIAAGRRPGVLAGFQVAVEIVDGDEVDLERATRRLGRCGGAAGQGQGEHRGQRQGSHTGAAGTENGHEVVHLILNGGARDYCM